MPESLDLPKVIIGWQESWNLLVHLNKYLLSIYYVSSAVMGARDIQMSKTFSLRRMRQGQGRQPAGGREYRCHDNGGAGHLTQRGIT